MNTPKKQIRYQCHCCYKWHEDELEAASCCPIDTKDVYLCGDCGTEHDDESDAELCCSEAGNPKTYQQNIQALEAAGQQRIFQD